MTKIFYSINELVEMLGMSRASILRMEKSGDFPCKVKIGKRRVGWMVKDVEEWVSGLKRTSDQI